MSLKSDLAERIKFKLGYPMIKLELNDDIINNNIEYTRRKFIKWAAGQAGQDVFFTMMLSGGQYLYDMPGGTLDVISYDASPAFTGGINTLFTVAHVMYEQGIFGILNPSSASGYNLISYQIARNFLKTLNRYIVDGYNFKYHKHTNQLEIQPPPVTGNTIAYNGQLVDSPGWILIRAYMLSGSTLPGWEDLDSDENDLYENLWIEDYSTAKCKESLGYIRRKFANFNALGNVGIAMDGDALISEALTAMEKLEDQLKNEETWYGYPIIFG
jgi:hypothetical protein